MFCKHYVIGSSPIASLNIIGEMTEWLMVADCKSAGYVEPTWVQIPLSPNLIVYKNNKKVSADVVEW